MIAAAQRLVEQIRRPDGSLLSREDIAVIGRIAARIDARQAAQDKVAAA